MVDRQTNPTPEVPPADPTRLASARARLDALIDWERRERREMRQGLDSMRALVAELGQPQQRYRVVHVAGTKGKGSVAALVSAGLVGAGLRVGTYGSPHVERLNERVRIDGEPVGDELLALGLEAALTAREALQARGVANAAGEAPLATWFDLLTAAGLWIFAREEVDWAVVEAGLGGRLDSTNVVQGEVCVVTNIDLEHTEVLGSTRAAIATEKAGILGRGAMLVTSEIPHLGLPAEEDAGAALQAVATRLAAEVHSPEASRRGSIGARNRALAGQVLDCLGARAVCGADAQVLSSALLTDECVLAAALPGRLERFTSHGTFVLLDGAHVASSLSLVLAECAPGPAPGCAVVALGKDKDALGFLKALLGVVDTVWCTSVAGGLHLSPADLAALVRQAGLQAEPRNSPEEALQGALEQATARGGWVLATGSLYLAGTLRPLLAR